MAFVTATIYTYLSTYVLTVYPGLLLLLDVADGILQCYFHTPVTKIDSNTD